MTKTLTEQWREGTLDSGWYYIKIYWGAGYDIIFDNYNPTTGLFVDFGKEVKEVLAPVPSYEKWKNMDDLLLIYKEENKRLKAVKEHCENVAGQYADKLVDTERNVEHLEKRLAIATKALDYCRGFDFARQALKEIEGVK